MRPQLYLLAVAAIAFYFAQTTSADQPGDANCDGSTNPIDAALVLQVDAGFFSALPCAANADANGDGSADPIDAALILQHVAGLIDLYPAPSATATHTPTVAVTATNTPTATPTARPTATPTPAAILTPTATATPTATPTPPARDPSLYWFDCRVACHFVLAADVACMQTPPNRVPSTVHCISEAGGWEMDCSISGIGGPAGTPHADCFHSRDGSFACESAGGERLLSFCDGPVWFGACSSTVSSAFHCWRTDALGMETIDCSIGLNYACTPSLGPPLTCGGQGELGSWVCSVEPDTTATPTPTATSTPDPLARDPSLYWFDCRSACRLVISADVVCQQTPPGLARSNVHCVSRAGGWQMDCSTTYVNGWPHAECLHSQDGPLTCQAAIGLMSGSCEGPVWFGACSSTVSSAFHCWRTDALGTETIDCSISAGSVEGSLKYSCTPSLGASLTCERDNVAGTWVCAVAPNTKRE